MYSAGESKLFERVELIEEQIDDIKKQIGAIAKRMDDRNTNRHREITTLRNSDLSHDKRRDEQNIRFKESLRRHNRQMTVLVTIASAIWIVALITRFV